MKRCFCYLLTLVLGSLAVGGLVFALLRTDVLTLTAATPTALFFSRPPLPPVLAACWPICWAACWQTARRPWRTPGSAAGRPPLWAPWGRC